MPTYNYYCEKCEIVQEQMHGMLETPEITCPKCQAVMKKLISAGVGFIMKSGGTRRTYQKIKKFSHTPTPTESAAAKADEQRSEKSHDANMSKDPYYQFRNT